MTRHHAPGFWGRLKEYKEFIMLVVACATLVKIWVGDIHPFINHVWGAADRADSAYSIAVRNSSIATQTQLEVDTIKRVLKDSMYARGTLLYHTDSMTRALEEGQRKIMARLTAGGIAMVVDSFPERLKWRPLHYARFTVQ